MERKVICIELHQTQLITTYTINLYKAEFHRELIFDTTALEATETAILHIRLGLQYIMSQQVVA